jgi:hypothetical protein
MHQKQLLIAFPNQSCFFEKEGVVRSNSANSFLTVISKYKQTQKTEHILSLSFFKILNFRIHGPTNFFCRFRLCSKNPCHAHSYQKPYLT